MASRLLDAFPTLATTVAQHLLDLSFTTPGYPKCRPKQPLHRTVETLPMASRGYSRSAERFFWVKTHEVNWIL